MNGELAQAVALASHASTWLAQPGGSPPPRLDTEHPTFRFVRSVAFTSPGLPAGLEAVAPWLLMLREEGVERLWLATGPSRGWSLLATGRAATTWTGSWTLGDRDAPDRRIWDVRYTGAPAPATATVPTSRSIEAARGLLVEALVAIEDFAREHELGFWADYFAKARDLQGAGYLLDLLPSRGYGEAAERLVAMASQAWVFGGMGSWNDLGFPDAAENDRYQAVTARLYEAVLGSIVAAVNVELG